MKETTLFEYTGGGGFLFGIRPGIKLVSLIVFSIASVALPPALFPVPVLFAVILLLKSGRAERQQFFSMWKLFLFFTAAGAVRGFTSSSVIDGVLFTSRLIILAAAGVLFYSSTKLTELRSGLKRVLSFIPLINGPETADMVVMAVSFLPLIFKTMNQLKEARYSRCFSLKAGFFRSSVFTTVPLIINMLIKTEEITDAWYSRGYNPDKK